MANELVEVYNKLLKIGESAFGIGNKIVNEIKNSSFNIDRAIMSLFK